MSRLKCNGNGLRKAVKYLYEAESQAYIVFFFYDGRGVFIYIYLLSGSGLNRVWNDGRILLAPLPIRLIVSAREGLSYLNISSGRG